MIGASFSSLLAQKNAFTITGRVLERESNSPVPFATIALISNNNQKVFKGTTTNENGEFIIQTDSASFIVEVSFIGYQKLLVTELNFSNGNKSK